MKIGKATAKYEAWLARHLRLLEADLNLKHQQMRLAPFPFMRATYYRWAQTWAEVCGEAARAPRVLAVGDLHVENFGTWRDIEGRLIWGINDFDEAWRLPYTNDLIRLAASALLAKMDCEPKAGIGGHPPGLYARRSKPAGVPLRWPSITRRCAPWPPRACTSRRRSGKSCTPSQDVKDKPPAGAIKAITRMMPERGFTWRMVHRVAGLGSLGRERYVAIADWRGGSVAREAKALAPSACVWAEEGKGTAPILYQEILDRSVRCRDPFVRLQRRWIVRRLAPDCSRIELSALPKERDELRLLHAMGWETANIHLGTHAAARFARRLEKEAAWLAAGGRAKDGKGGGRRF